METTHAISPSLPAPATARAAVLRHAVVWGVLLVIAFVIDVPVARALQDSGVADVVNESKFWSPFVKTPGEFWFIVTVAALLCVFHPWKWKAGAFFALSGVMSAVNAIVKWGFGRQRPFTLSAELLGNSPQPGAFVLQPFRGGLPGLFHQSNLSFVSGHACLAFASATALSIMLPRWRLLFYTFATLTGLQRIAENAHYCSDVVGAAALGVYGVWFIKWACDRGMDRGK